LIKARRKISGVHILKLQRAISAGGCRADCHELLSQIGRGFDGVALEWNTAGLQQRVTVRQFRDLPEALLAKGSLESAGIECFLADENLVRLDWFISNFIGGIKLNVRAPDAENAQQLLDEPILEGLYVQGIGLYEQPRCPKCQSLDVNFQELDRPIAYMSAFLRVPMPIQRPAWRCHACDAEWEDDGTEDGRGSALP